MVLLAKHKEDLKGMLRRFKRYLTRKQLTLNVEKSKIIVFENGRGRKKKREWKWGDESRRGYRNKRFRIYDAKEWRSGEACYGKI